MINRFDEKINETFLAGGQHSIKYIKLMEKSPQST